MQYRIDRRGQPISVLGFGCMRFPQKLGRIDMEETEREILRAVEGGVNYFDTAYIYPGSESALGEILHRNHLRDQVKIATKLPHYLIRSRDGMDKMFHEQLRRLKTDHVDYYLMHMLTDTGAWDKMCALGVREWLEEKKRTGQIGQAGFSYHGNSDEFCRLIDAYDWDFCQIQYNYMDENSQAGRRGLCYAHEKGVPVVIMEPLRGGKLVRNLPKEALSCFRNAPVQRTPADWALRWLWDQKEVTCVLSGMNSMEMLEENMKTASETPVGSLTEQDQQMLRNVVAAINAKMKVGCTGCGYCMPCPGGVDIPGTFAAYNRRHTEDKTRGLIEYAMCTAFRKQSTAASRCIGCGKCERHCPQHLPIREKLRDAADDMEGLLYKTLRKAVEVFKIFG